MFSLLLLLAQTQTIEYQSPPAQEYTLRAMVPGLSPPLRVPGRPTDSRLVLTLEDGTPVTEVCVRAPAGTTSLPIEQGLSPAGPSFTDALNSWVARPARVVLWIDGLEFLPADYALQ